MHNLTNSYDTFLWSLEVSWNTGSKSAPAQEALLRKKNILGKTAGITCLLLVVDIVRIDTVYFFVKEQQRGCQNTTWT